MAAVGASSIFSMGRRDAGDAGPWTQFMRLSYRGWVTEQIEKFRMYRMQRILKDLVKHTK